MDKDTIYKFVILGRPRSQKNNIKVYRNKKTNRPMVNHTIGFHKLREKISLDIHKQYCNQGGSTAKPIDCLVDISFVFYVTRQSEPDLDNLPQVFLDAMQGFKVKVSRGTKRTIAVTLIDDKLVRKELSEKIIKGEPKYNGEPRTEIEIRRYYP
jgi:Holliday junction resolvase RusA-like endonuclease